MTAAAARVSARADAAAADAANDARGEVTKIPGVTKAIAAKAVKNGLGQMPAYANLSDAQIEAVARYVAKASGAAK